MNTLKPIEGTTQGRKRARLAIAGLSFLGMADALYMLAYHGRVLDSLTCPIFGQGCNAVGRSRPARHFGIPNAAVGALGYAAMGLLALASGDARPEQRPLKPVAIGAISIGAFISSIVLTWEQAVRVKAWCFWCLLSTCINLAILPLALGDALRGTARLLKVRRRKG